MASIPVLQAAKIQDLLVLSVMVQRAVASPAANAAAPQPAAP
jgi:hypothetical protein